MENILTVSVSMFNFHKIICLPENIISKQALTYAFIFSKLLEVSPK